MANDGRFDSTKTNTKKCITPQNNHIFSNFSGGARWVFPTWIRPCYQQEIVLSIIQPITLFYLINFLVHYVKYFVDDTNWERYL